MAGLYHQGAAVSVVGLSTIDPSAVRDGDYIYEYKGPAFIYSIVPTDVLVGTMKGWINLQTAIEGGSVTITGVQVDTDTGEVFVRAQVVKPPPVTIKDASGNDIVVEVSQAGVNPLVVLQIVGGLFVLLGVGLTLLYVYDAGVSSGVAQAGGAPLPDPCTQAGFLNYIRCATKKASWVGGGIAVGVLLAMVLIILVAGRSSRS